MHTYPALTVLAGVTLISAAPFRSSVVKHHPYKRGSFPNNFLNSSSQCQGSKDTTSWTSNDFGDFLTESASDLQPFSQGIFGTFVSAVPGLASTDFSCGFDQPCTFDQFNDVCPQNPEVVNVLFAMTNFANFWQKLAATVKSVSENIVGQAAQMSTEFGPTASATVAANNAEKDIGLGLAIIGTLAGLIPGLAPIGAGISLAGSATSFAAGFVPTASTPDGTFDNFADISQSVSSLADNINNALSQFVDTTLNNIPEASGYNTDPNQIPQLLAPGGFAAPTSDIPAQVSQALTAQFAAPNINHIWAQSQVVVVVANKNDLPSGVDPCEGDNIFPAAVKFCDSDGNAHVLQSVPTNDVLSGLSNLDQVNTETYAVPGFANIGDFNLDVQAITVAAENNQASTNAYQSPGPAPSDFVSTIEGINPTDVQLSDTIFFNLPVCVYADNPPFDTAAEDFCKNHGADPQENCEFYHQLLVGCPQQTVAGVPWPYNTQDDSAL